MKYLFSRETCLLCEESRREEKKLFVQVTARCTLSCGLEKNKVCK